MTSRVRAQASYRRRSLAAIVASVGLVAAACGGDDGGDSAEAGADGSAAGATAGGSGEGSGDGGSQATGDPYKVAYLGPLSGPLAGLGNSQLQAVNAVVDRVNSEGGINGHPIEVVAEDDAGDPGTGIAASRQLVSDDVLVFIGPPVSSMVEAVLPTTSQADVSIITPGATPAVLNPAQRTVFQVDHTSSSQAQPMVDFAEALVGRSDISIAAAPIDTPSGIAWGEDLEKLDAERDFTLVSTTPVPAAAGTDITPQALKIVESNPDVILVEMIDAGFVSLAKRLREQGYEGPIVNFHGGSTQDVFEQLKDPEVYSARTYMHYDESSDEPAMKQYVKDVQASGTEELALTQSLFGSVYVGAEVAMAAIETCGDSCDAAAVTDALNQLTLELPGLTHEPVEFTADDHQAMNADVFYHWSDGEVVPALDGEMFHGSVYSLEETGG